MNITFFYIYQPKEYFTFIYYIHFLIIFCNIKRNSFIKIKILFIVYFIFIFFNDHLQLLFSIVECKKKNSLFRMLFSIFLFYFFTYFYNTYINLKSINKCNCIGTLILRFHCIYSSTNLYIKHKIV